MNYRHAYHAGNHGDVLKHAVLAESVRRLQDKATPLFLLDTHAGIGLYDLSAAEAEKTGEWRAGIGTLFDTSPIELGPYLDIVRALNPAEGLARYPGSPAILSALLRPGDRLVLAEVHPDDAHALRIWARHKAGVSVHLRDGYESIRAFLPPPEKRGLVIVDPPYEASNEIERLTASVIAGHRRWPGGRWLIWHPIKDRAPIWRLQDVLLTAGIGDMLSVELVVRPVDGVSLAGSGLILINPPFGLDAWLATILPELQSVIAPQHGSYALRWLGQ